MITSATTRRIPLDQLTLSEQNVRTNIDTTSEFSELKASIVAHGLINPLLATRHGKQGYRVVAGGRRLRAMLELIAEDRLPADYDVPVQVVTQENAEELSLVENFMRADLKPYETYRAFAMVQDKHPDTTVETLAERFGMSVTEAFKVLRLGNLIPEIMELYASGEINDAQAQAFAASACKVAQTHAFATWQQAGQYDRHPNFIRKWLGMGDRELQADLKMVGCEAYEAAGGRFEKDLFTSDFKILDSGILATLVAAHKQKIADELAAETGVRVEVIASLPTTKNGMTDWSREIHPEEKGLSDEDEVRLMEIEAALERLEHEEDAEEQAAYEAEWAALDAKRTIVLPCDVQITLDGAGNPRYWKAEGTVEEEPEVKTQPEEKQVSAASGTAITEMGRMRRERFREHVTDDVDIAKNGYLYLTFVLARQAYDGAKLPGVEWVSQLGSPSWSQDDWMRERDLDKAWALFVQHDRSATAMDMVAMMVLPTVRPINGGFTEWLSLAVNPMRWVSTPEFWSMFRKGQIFDMLDEVAPQVRHTYSNSKQDEVRALAHRLCSGQLDPKTSVIPVAEQAAASTWVPSWLRLTLEDVDGPE